MTGNRAVIYARYSSHAQREESIEDQLRVCREYAASLGMTVVREYHDSAITGRTDERPAFQRMVRDSENHRWDAVICYKLDRFARNRYDSAVYKARLRKHGVRVLYAKEAIPDGPEGIILESVLEGYAEYYSENLGQNIKRGMEGNALKCHHNGVRVFGYSADPDTGRYVIDPDAAATVRRIYALALEGVPQKKIADRLNAEGERRPGRRPWTLGAVGKMLDSEKYAGVYSFGDVRVEGGMPAIIDRETWDAVHAMRTRHRHRPPVGDDAGYLLTGRLLCGVCGRSMVGVSGNGNGGRYSYYRCQGHASGCPVRPVRRDAIEGAVTDAAVSVLASDERIGAIADACMRYQSDATAADSALKALEARADRNTAAIANVVAAVEAGMLSDELVTRMKELQREKAAIAEAIDAERARVTPPVPREAVVSWLRSFAAGDVDDEAFRRRVLEAFVGDVWLYEDGRVLVTWNYSGDGGPARDELPAMAGGSYSCELVDQRGPMRTVGGRGWFGVVTRIR